LRLRDLITDTLQTLAAHKLRTALTMFGIAWGIVSIMLMVGAGEGLRVGQQRVSEGFGKNVMIVFAGRTSMQAGGARAGRRVRWESSHLPLLVEKAPDCEYILPELGQGNIQVKSSHNSGLFMVTASAPPFAEVRSIDLREGRFYNWTDYNEERRVAIIGSEVYQQLFPGRAALGEPIYLGGIPYTIIGVMQHKQQDSSYDGRDVNKVFVPYTVMRRDFPNRPPDTPWTLDRLLVTPKSVPEHESCKQQLRAALGSIYGFDPNDKEAAGIWDTVENAKAFHQMTLGMKYFLGAVGIVTLLLGGIGVMNVMLVAVRERTREIGVRMAVGATRATILRQFFLESLLVVLVSGVAGFSVAFGITSLVNLIPMPPFFAGLLPTWEAGLGAFLLLGTVSVLAAMYPARRAASIDPIEALRYEAGG
jgi:putative ABC transport system permease protein